MKRWQNTTRGRRDCRKPGGLRSALLVCAISMTGIPALAVQTPADIRVTDARGHSVTITRHVLEPGPARNIPYPGGVSLTRRDFPTGFPLALGSGLAFKGLDGGNPTFWAVSDRGPNGDGPNVEGEDSKIFPAPRFAPAFGLIRMSGD